MLLILIVTFVLVIGAFYYFGLLIAGIIAIGILALLILGCILAS